MTLDIITPERYVRGRGALHEAGDAAGAFLKDGNHARNILVIGGKTALAKTWGALGASLDRAGVRYEVREYAGYPNHGAARAFAREAREKGCGAIAGVGGGRILDTAKSAAAEAGLPVIAAPTIAATCAGFAAVTIMYTEEGVFTEAVFRKNAPALAVVDTDVIAAAPAAYLRAGVADSLAKWYEAAPAALRGGGLYARLALKYGELIRDVLERYGPEVADGVEKGAVNEAAFNDVLDAVFLLTGLCGSITTAQMPRGIAHPLYNALSHYPALRKRLHGEKVAFGYIAQGVLGNEEEKDVLSRVLTLKRLNIPLTFEALGFGADGDLESQLAETAARVKSAEPDYGGLDRPYTAEDLVKAMKQADKYARSVA
ncbi:MAG: iron-containing alcohol dehydrogenase [Spirochaetaceae bacterium]|jgi:glycerol dehydrogenase|nr:iron-containing alcohol dehydrogenase [Spirochaetaceae bacterium]